VNNGKQIPAVLQESLWHTTTMSRYRRIVEAGHILPNPPLTESQRWFTKRGPGSYPYVRHLGGVSLFDFRGFDPDKYEEDYPLSTWWTFVPFIKQRGASVWIEVDQSALGENYVSGEALLTRHREDRAHKHMIMPLIEAACLGPVPVTAFRRVLIASADNPQLRPL
jgi:hypothetical protein